MSLEGIQLDSEITYEEKSVKILEYASRVTRSKVIEFCKVQWSHHTEDEATWEREEDLLKDHPHLFSSQPESRGRDSGQGPSRPSPLLLASTRALASDACGAM